MNQALSTQIPQIGDSSQQLLARMAAAAADQNQSSASVVWLVSAARTTTQNLNNLVPPNGAKGLIFRIVVSAVPGVDTIQAKIYDSTNGRTVAQSTAGAGIGQHFVAVSWFGSSNVSPAVGFSAVSGLYWTDNFGLEVTHSGVGSFTYSTSYRWIR